MRWCMLLLAVIVCGGCDAGVSEEELGTIHHEMPPVPGTETPYQLPELEESAPSNASGSDAPDGAPHDHDHRH